MYLCRIHTGHDSSMPPIDKIVKVKDDHRSKFSNLSNWKEEAGKKKIRASTGFEPVTSAIPVRCSTN